MSIKFTVNGFPYEVEATDFAPDITLNAFLREHLHLTATKYMCLEGGCGSCVCVIRRRHPVTQEVQSRAANSCLTLLNTCDDAEIITDEGLGNQLSGYHPIQKRLAQLNGTQCGYCSPGFVMNMYGLLEQHQGQVSMAQVEDAFGGNICRCTGYRPILDAMKSFAVDSTVDVPSECIDIEDSFELLCLKTGQACKGSCSRPPVRDQSGNHWYWPKSLVELFAALSQVGSGELYILVAGNTAHGVYRRPRTIRHFIDVNKVPELKQYRIEADYTLLGANLTLDDAMQVFLETAKRPGFEYCVQLWQHFNLIANVPVRNVTTPTANVSEKFKSGGQILQRPLSSGLQQFQTQKKSYPVTQAVEKVEGMIQCSGEATYMNDVLTTSNAVHCAFVGATKVGATIDQIDASEALKQPGVIVFYSAKDIPGTNTFVEPSFGFVAEEIFCSGLVRHSEQPAGVVVALTADQAHRAAKLVKISYSNPSPDFKLLPSLTDVFASSTPDPSQIVAVSESKIKKIKFSDQPDKEVRGIFQMGLQYHFTMEPHTTVAIPFEDGLKVFSATQWMDLTQSVIAHMIQVKAKDVQLQVRRLGGGYGSKITRGNQVACAAALAAYKLNRPARFVQTIESMMDCNGKRWACRSDYQCHVKSNGKIVGMSNDFYEDAGWNLNESPIDGHSTFTAANCYEFTGENFKINGNAVLTDAPSSTWCRAPGSVEGIAMMENIVEHVAFEVQKDPAEVRLLNIAAGNKMTDLLPQFLQSREYYKRKQQIETHNSKNRWTKRGLGLAVMDYPIFYFGQYPATVAIYHVDGTVVVTHGGIEMGQGMNTKVAQVAAFTLGIDLSFVKVESSDTINGANCMVTGGAVGSESLCFAVRKACDTLNDRLKAVKKDGASWVETVEAAYAKSINLIASDHYKEGDMQNYHVYGLALTEIELDVLTGNNQITRVDILEDAGESLSPYIDVGQVEGAFVMCLGYWLSEQLVYDRETGRLLTNRTWNYKPPGAKDIPIDFRIELIQKPNPNGAGFMRSKATGEPPCCLAVSVVFALQQALQSARQDAGLPREWVRLGAPTTPETLVLNAGHEVATFRLK
ncbi:uncharacterized protein [Drosophila bipectinata]|uniref:uncharacterized protein n=1 Tax=Drosophila bipectinata TaxID=42026 RepID=UPI0038B2A53A